MRAFFILALAVLTLIASTNAVPTSTKQDDSAILTQADTEVKPISDRFLRADTAEDEERGIADLVKKLGTGAKAWMKNARLKATVYLKTNAADLDVAAESLVQKKINPDQIYILRKLDNPSNRVDKEFTTQFSPSMLLWRKHYDLWMRANPTWKTQIGFPPIFTAKVASPKYY